MRLEHRPAHWTYDDSCGPAYYFAPDNAAEPPYLRQVEVKAILDVAADGTLAGVELVFGQLPPPPEGHPVGKDAMIDHLRDEIARLRRSLISVCDVARAALDIHTEDLPAGHG